MEGTRRRRGAGLYAGFDLEQTQRSALRQISPRSYYPFKTAESHINSLFTELVTEPADFGFKNSVLAAFDPKTGAVVPDPNDFLFWDGFHPTTNAHFFAAEFIYRSILFQSLLFEGEDTPLAQIESWLPVGPH